MSDTLVTNENSQLLDSPAVGALPGDPPPAPELAATTGAGLPPTGPDAVPGADAPSDPAPLIDTPEAGHAALAAFNQAEPGTPAELVPTAPPLAAEIEALPGLEPDAPPPVETAPPEIGIDPFEEDPLVTINRIRTKLSAYGEECLKTVQPEIEYLIRLCDNSNDID